MLLYAIIIPRTRLRVNLHSAVAWMSRNSLLEAGTNLKWQQQDSKCGYMKNNTLWLVDLWTYLLWTRINGMSHKKYEKIFRPTTGIILCSIEVSFFSILSKNMVLLPWTEKNNTFCAFTRISFFNVYEILLCTFCLMSMKSIEM